MRGFNTLARTERGAHVDAERGEDCLFFCCWFFKKGQGHHKIKRTIHVLIGEKNACARLHHR